MSQAKPAAPEGFSASWLQLREPFDTWARDAAAARLGLGPRPGTGITGLRQQLAGRASGSKAPLRIIDLGCGTGANLRWLAPRLGDHQQWLVVDHDRALLRHWPQALAPAAAVSAGSGRQDTAGHAKASGTAGTQNGSGRAVRSGTSATSGHSIPTPQSAHGAYPLLHFTGPGFQAQIVRQRLDLARDLHRLPWPAAQLVTASALLDLVSAAWLQQLVAAATSARAALLLALSVDGRQHWAPADADDARVLALFHAHQQRDKGLGGPALGTAAGPALMAALRQAGYRVRSVRSDWQPQADAPSLALQRALIEGVASAAAEQQPAEAARVQAWRQRRQALAAASQWQVGHLDVLGLPPR